MKLPGPAVLLACVSCLACLTVTGCSSDPQADYCEVVEDHQADLSDVAASDDAGAVFDALDVYEDLAAEAPRDIADEWAAVVGPLLVPGFGAQGGTVDDLTRILGSAARWALPSSSREVLRAGPDVGALRDAARRGNDAVRGLGA